MTFQITQSLKQPLCYTDLRRLADQYGVSVDGDEQTGSFSSGGVVGTYEFGQESTRGTFDGKGVKGHFTSKGKELVVTITETFLPGFLLKPIITTALANFCSQLDQG
jgi:hypothetical protein